MQSQKLPKPKSTVGDKIECLIEQFCFVLIELRKMFVTLEKIREKAAEKPVKGKIIPLRPTDKKLTDNNCNFK